MGGVVVGPVVVMGPVVVLAGVVVVVDGVGVVDRGVVVVGGTSVVVVDPGGLEHLNDLYYEAKVTIILTCF